jgi:hypothetical protein
MERSLPRRHVDVNRIIKEAERGNSYLVNRCAANGDLSGLPETEQRRIVATANDNAAAYAQDQIIPLTPDAEALQTGFIEKKLNFAWRVFANADGMSVAEQIKRLINSE